MRTLAMMSPEHPERTQVAIARKQPSSPLVGQRMTLEEFEKLPEEKPYLELWEGVVQQKVSPRERHAFLEYGVAELLNAFGRPRKIAVAIPELRCYLGSSFLVPDLAVYRWERLNRGADGRIQDEYAGPPDIVIEILSPDQRLSTMVEKCRFYIAHAVGIVLLIHPRNEWVRVFRSDGGVATLTGDDRIDLQSTLPDFELTPRMVFDTLAG